MDYGKYTYTEGTVEEGLITKMVYFCHSNSNTDNLNLLKNFLV